MATSRIGSGARRPRWPGPGGGRWPATLLVAAAVAAGCATAAPYVAVREAKFRTEDSRQDRIRLPLTVESRERLVRFLRAGGDRDRLGTDVVQPEAGERYGGLLDLLSGPPLATEELLGKATFSRWFTERPVRQVIDAREEAPPAIDPIAASDGEYWWIFYPRQGRLGELLVIRAIRPRLSR